MAKRHPQVTVRTYGIYSQWDSDSKDLPSFLESTDQVPAKIDVEFGLMVNIKGGKNLPINYCIDHPGILDDHGQPRAPFEGEVYVKSNDWDFFLGDTIWEPIADKIGNWTMTLELDGSIVAQQSFNVYLATPAAKPFQNVYRTVWIAGL